MTSLLRRGILAAIICVGISGLTLTSMAQTNGEPERFRATAMNLDAGGASVIDIVINRWSTDREHARLVSVLRSEGPEKLLEALREAPSVGYLQSGSNLGWDLHYARRAALPDGGAQVTVATDRPISFREAATRPVTIDYPFTVIEIHMNAEGKGEGKMSFATKITVNKDTNMIELENWGTQPVLLTNVTREAADHR